MMMRGRAGRYGSLTSLSEEPARKADARTVRRVAASFKPYWRQVLVVLGAILLTGVLGIVKFSVRDQMQTRGQ